MITQEDIRMMIKRYNSGETTSAIGMRYGVSAAAINYHLKRNGIMLRKVGRPLGREGK